MEPEHKKYIINKDIVFNELQMENLIVPFKSAESQSSQVQVKSEENVTTQTHEESVVIKKLVVSWRILNIRVRDPKVCSKSVKDLQR